MTQYFVSFFDMFKGWKKEGIPRDLVFSNIVKAIALCKRLQSHLGIPNKQVGEHFGVLERGTNREVFCGNSIDTIEYIPSMMIEE